MKLVSASELRANLKECLNRARDGMPVLIGRDNLVYELRLFQETTLYPIGETKVPGGKVIVPQPPKPFVSRPPDPETGYPCCLEHKPCKHWVFDGIQGVYINILTHKTIEVLS